ncbi:phosphotransferase, partial [Photobacterium sp. WH24]|nr:phosphotransferase [Photobacterium sp. WH24]
CVSNSDRQKLVTEIITRLQSLVTFMLAQADTGDEQFAQHIAAGYLADIDYLSLNENKIIEGIC